MTAANCARALKLVGLSEGGYTNHRLDRGNWYEGKNVGTNHGISAPVLADWIGRAPAAREMRALTKAEADKIYKAKYWDSVRGDYLPRGLDYAMFDYGVNSGPRRAIKALQRVVGAEPDGLFGGMTERALEHYHPKTIILCLMMSVHELLRPAQKSNSHPSLRQARIRKNLLPPKS
ncbi:MAG: hypothetical protein IIB62_09910 [Proteobacteria bacterium]|nr:hypothetical protein [Pseudomonadota bacterium]